MTKQVFGQFLATMVGTVLGLGAIIDGIPVRAATVNTNPDLSESWSFAFEDYAITHQGEALIDLTVSYDYVDGIGENDPFEYPEFTQIYNYIDNFLTNYPNETDFWEVLNKNLVTDLLTKPIPTAFGFDYYLADVLDSLTVDLDVQPGSSGVPYPRSSTVTGTPGTEVDLDESWSFGFVNYPIEHQGEATIDVLVSYNYVDGIGKDDPFEYPEFTQIYNYIDTFFTSYPNETDFWEILNKNLVTDLLTKPIPTAFGFDYNLENVVDDLTVKIDVHPGSSGVPYSRSSTVTGTVINTAQQPVPEPFTVLGGITAISFGAFFKNQISKKQNREKTNLQEKL